MSFCQEITHISYSLTLYQKCSETGLLTLWFLMNLISLLCQESLKSNKMVLHIKLLKIWGIFLAYVHIHVSINPKWAIYSWQWKPRHNSWILSKSLHLEFLRVGLSWWLSTLDLSFEPRRFLRYDIGFKLWTMFDCQQTQLVCGSNSCIVDCQKVFTNVAILKHIRILEYVGLVP